MIHKVLKHWPIILPLLLTFLLRIYKIEELFYFSFDEEVPAFVGRKLIEFGDISFLGGVTPFGFHLAPYFYWFLAFLLFFGKLNPIIWGYAGSAIAAVTALMMYLVGKEFFGKKVGYLAAIFWTFSYLAHVYDRHLWALYWGPLLALLVLFCLKKIIEGSHKFIYLLAVSLAFGIHADPSNLIFLALTAIVWVFYKIPIRKSTIFAVLIVILSFAPIIVFDLTHNFANTKPLVKYLSQGRAHRANNPQGFFENSMFFPKVFSRLIYPFTDNEIAKNYSYCQKYVNEKFVSIPFVFVAGASILLLVFVITSFKKTIGYRLLALLIIIYFAGIQFFGTVFKSDIFEHYITGLFPIFLIIFAIYVVKLPKKLWIVILAIFVSANLYKILKVQNSLGLKYKRQAIEYTINQVGNKEFSLESLSSCWKYQGYRYLFAAFGQEPIKSYVDPNLAYLYDPTRVSKTHPKIVVSLVTHDFVDETKSFYKSYAKFKAHEIQSNTFGNIEVIIMDNSSHWFAM